MNIKLFYHSLISCWNHDHAHFLRGIVAELLHRGYEVQVYEPTDGWSYENLIREQGAEASINFKKHFPKLKTNFYYPTGTDFEALVWDADLVIVHEWNSSELIGKLGELKGKFNYQLLFHDTHRRAQSTSLEKVRYDLSNYDGVLAFGEVIRNQYLKNGWAKRAWTWHEAADTRVFYPRSTEQEAGDLVWIGNWTDEEKAAELEEYLIRPVKELGLKASVYGVRYPEKAIIRLEKAGISYKGWLPNYLIPHIFSQYKLTIHVPHPYYTQSLPGIPSIYPFEAMACGIPLISSPWQDSEGLFETGKDFWMVHGSAEMKQAMQELLQKPEQANEFSASGLERIRNHHTCTQRVEQLLTISQELAEAKKSQKKS